jgi:hypothetical protein
MSMERPRAGISVFLSYPKPWRADQDAFVARVQDYLEDRGLAPRTLGITDYDMDAPLKAIRRLMLESNGLVTLAFARTHVTHGVMKRRGPDHTSRDGELHDVWMTTPWAHIEPAMAYQLGLPVLIIREAGVIADGVLEQGVLGTYMPEVDLNAQDDYFESEAWRHVIGKWEGYVRAVVETKGNPPKMY